MGGVAWAPRAQTLDPPLIYTIIAQYFWRFTDWWQHVAVIPCEVSFSVLNYAALKLCHIFCTTWYTWVKLLTNVESSGHKAYLLKILQWNRVNTQSWWLVIGYFSVYLVMSIWGRGVIYDWFPEFPVRREGFSFHGHRKSGEEADTDLIFCWFNTPKTKCRFALDDLS